MSVIHEKALKFMRDNVGKHEVPMGSNTGPFVLECQRATWLGGTRWPWCVAAWVKAWTVAGYKLPYKGAGAYTMLAWYKQHLPGWVVSAEKARPGSAVIFNIGSGHCGMLAKPYADTKPYVETIDGNVGDKVSPERRHISEVRGMIDPLEVGSVIHAKPPKVFEVVGSVSGHKKVVFVSGAKGVGKKLPQLLNHFGGVTIRRRKRK